MNTFLVSDTHFNHNNIIKYCDRPFNSVSQMDDDMIHLWNSKVAKEDIVYHLGDFALGSKEQLSELRERLNGRIRLIMGNHDTFKLKDYYQMGFDRVYDKPIIIEQFYILSHEPLFITEIMPYVNIFGHVHNNPQYNSFTSNSACVCVERTEYKPMNFENVNYLLLK